MFSNPELNIAKLGLKDGMKVADLGAGMGLYSKAASKRIGSNGIVYAVEVQKDLLKKLEAEIKDWKITNIKGIWGDIEEKGGTKIADHIIDAVIISNVLFQIEDKLGLVDETKRILKKGGKVLFIDWSNSFNKMGPIPEHIINEKEVIELFSSRGLKLLEKITISDHHYGIIFTHE